MRKLPGEYVNYLREFLGKKHQLFDRDILYISVGALTVTFSFIDKVVDIKSVDDKTLLFCSWICFAISILNCLIATHVNISRIRELLDSGVVGDELTVKGEKYRVRTNKIMQVFRMTSIVLISVGIIFLLLFVINN